MKPSRLRGKPTILVAIATMFGIASAEAQVLPEVELPVSPAIGQVVDGSLNAADRTLRSANLREVRKIQVRDLLRRHRRVLERDARGEPVIRREVLSLAPSRESLENAQRAGFSIAREQAFEELGTRIVVLLAPERMSARRALQRLQELDPEGTYDYNHVYLGSGGAVGASTSSSASHADPSPVRASSVRIGLIDGGVLQTHPVFGTTTFRSHGCDGLNVPSEHGTSVASLIAAQIDDRALELFSADVYCDQPTGGSVTAVAAAFAWMARENVPIINVSLVGPSNRMLERIVRAMIDRGHVVVAAVGNDGPNAKPLYPAAYEGVVGVTGVDKRERALPEALRGPQVDFAAVGAEVAAASLDGKYTRVRGTSFAAPVVAALLATECRDVTPDSHSLLLEKYSKVARDLGAPGFDPTYGFGLLSAAVVEMHARRVE